MNTPHETTSEEDKKPLTYTEFMQVGAMIACGHCNPDKYVPTDPCTCNCHYAMSEEVKEKLGEFYHDFPHINQVIERFKVGESDSWDFTARFKEKLSLLTRTQRSLAQQEILDRVSQEARKHLSNNEDVNTLLDILSTLKDTNI